MPEGNAPYMKPRQNDRKIFLVKSQCFGRQRSERDRPIPNFPVANNVPIFLRVLQQDCSLSFVKSRLCQDPPTARVPNIRDGFKEFYDEAVSVRKVVLQGRQPSPQENI